jgi:hypothetical protein
MLFYTVYLTVCLIFDLKTSISKKVSLVKEKDNVLGILKMSLNKKSVRYFPRNTHSNMTRRCSKFGIVYDLNLLDFMLYFRLENVNVKKVS